MVPRETRLVCRRICMPSHQLALLHLRSLSAERSVA